MKYIAMLLLTLSTTLHLNAQLVSHQQIQGIEEPGSSEYGVYYKDLNNVFDNFVGTYEYTGSDFYFKLVLKRKNYSNMNNYFWEDMIVGGYKYIKNGVVIDYEWVNPGAMLCGKNEAEVWASSIQPYESDIFCPDCLQQKWLRGAIFDPVRKKSAKLYIARKVQNGQVGLQLWVAISASVQEPWESDEPIQLPTGMFFVKKIN